MSDFTPFRVVRSGHLTLSATAQQLPTSPATGNPPATGLALSGRRRIIIDNDDATNQARIGDSTITAGVGGTLIAPKGTLVLDNVGADCALFAIADAATPQISWNEFA